MKVILIVNGRPRAGKDTFANILNEFIPVYKYSIIDKVKVLAYISGWRGQKDERDRKYLYELKKLTDEYCEMSYKDVLKRIEMFYENKIKEEILIIDVRDPDEMARLVEDTNAFTVYIDNKNVPAITSNPADANVDKGEYDFGIDNNGTLEEFRDTIAQFAGLLRLITGSRGEE